MRVGWKPRGSLRGTQTFGSRRGPARRLPRLDPIEERGHGLDHPPRISEHHEVVGIERLELAVRHQSMVLDGRGVRHQHVAAAVDDQHRRFKAFENPAQGPLVRVVEVARVCQIEHRAVESAEVRRRLVQQPQTGELQAVDRMIQMVLAEQLELLHTDRRQHDQRAHSIGFEVGHV